MAIHIAFSLVKAVEGGGSVMGVGLKVGIRVGLGVGISTNVAVGSKVGVADGKEVSGVAVGQGVGVGVGQGVGVGRDDVQLARQLRLLFVEQGAGAEDSG